MNRLVKIVVLAGLGAVLWGISLGAGWVRAAEPEATELVADKLSAATVTVRTIPARAVGNYATNNSLTGNSNFIPATGGKLAGDKSAEGKDQGGKDSPGKDSAGKNATPPEVSATKGYTSPPKGAAPPANPATAKEPAANSSPPTGNYTTAGSNLFNNLAYNNTASGNFDNNDAVTVCSGVAVGNGLVVTFNSVTTFNGAVSLNNPALNNTATNNTATRNTVASNDAGVVNGAVVPQAQASRYRVTLPDGQQAKATLRVVDHYSGLSLLDLGDAALPALELNTTLPRVGSTVLSAAASGIERPVVSMGIVSSVDRSLSGSDFPPLLQCDLHTTETSSGAALVDRGGKLVGIIVATSATGQASGWTFAVPARHVQRLIDAAAKAKPDSVTILERRRPSVGLTMGPGAKEGTVEVEHVVAGGAADRAGIRKGDLVLEAEGRKIRSAYQAVDLVLNRQPGEKIDLVVQHGDERKSLQVTLEGSATEPAAQQQANYDSQQVQVGPQVAVRRDQQTNQIEIRNDRNGGELNTNVTQRGVGQNYGLRLQNRMATDDAALRTRLGELEKEAFRLQQELTRRDQRAAQADAEREALREEVARLRKQLEAGKK